MQLLRCTASLPWGSRQCNSCNALPYCPGGSGQCHSCSALPHCLGAVDSATPAMHCLTAWGQGAVGHLQCIASLPWGSGQCNSCNALPHCPGAVGSATPAMHCPTALGQWAVELLQCTASLPGGSGQWNSCNALPHCLGAVGSATPATHCLTAWGQWAVELLKCTASLPGGSGQRAVVGVSCRAGGEVVPGTPASGDGESCLGGARSLLQGPWEGVILREPGTPAWGGRGVQPRGWSEPPSRPMGRRHLRRTGPTGLGGTGSPAQGVVGASFKAHGEASSSENRANRPGGDGESCLGGARSLLQGPWGGVFFGEPGPPAWGGRGVQPRGWSEPPSRPMGRRHLRRTGPTGLGGTGSPAQGVVGASFKAHGEASSSENRANRPGGDGESSPGGGRSLLQGPWGGVFFGEPGPPAWGGRGVQPRGWSEPPARPMGRHHLRRTGPTGLGGAGSPAQGVVGASFRAHGEASSSENRAHRPGGDGESSPGGGRSLLLGPWGGVTFGEPGPPAWGGRGVQPKGWSEPPSRPMGRRYRATMLRRVPCPGTPRPVAMHRASARAGAPHIRHVFPSGPSLPAHLDACHGDPALESPRFRARAPAFTRPAADAGPWRRAARALPACERGVGCL